MKDMYPENNFTSKHFKAMRMDNTRRNKELDKKATFTEKDLQAVIKLLDRMKEWQYLVTFRKIYPFISIEKKNIITVGELKDYREYKIMKKLMKKTHV